MSDTPMTMGMLAWEGILYGLALLAMVGPILITIVQAGFDHGFWAGLLVSLGIWVSDILIISILLALMQDIDPSHLEGNFKWYSGLIGGLVLMAFGVASMLKKNNITQVQVALTTRHVTGYWVKGFLVNTINPFTFIFWMSLIATYNIAQGVNGKGTWIFYGAIMFVLMIGNTLQVWAAKIIKTRLTPNNLVWIGRVSGGILLIFGLVLIWRSTLQ